MPGLHRARAARGGTPTPGARSSASPAAPAGPTSPGPCVEAMAFQTRDVVDAMSEASGHPIRALRADGGASAMRPAAAAPGRPAPGAGVAGRVVQETTALGAAYLAGLAEGVWGSPDDITANWALDADVRAPADAGRRRRRPRRVARAVERSRGWAHALTARRAHAATGRHRPAGAGDRPAEPGRLGVSGPGGDVGHRAQRATDGWSSRTSSVRSRETGCRRSAPAPPPGAAPGRGTAVPSRPERRAPGRRRAAAPRRRRRARRRRRRPGPTTGCPATKATSHGAGGHGALLARRTSPSSSSTTADHVGADRARRRARTSASSALDRVGGADEDGRRLERVEPGVVEGVGRRADLLDVDAVDLLDLGDEQLDQSRAVGQLDHQLVDGPAGAPLEDVDADDVAPHRADAAGHLPERAGSVRQPHADDVGLHGERTLRRPCEPRCFRAGHGPREPRWGDPARS